MGGCNMYIHTTARRLTETHDTEGSNLGPDHVIRFSQEVNE